jgi:hypothetical protein
VALRLTAGCGRFHMLAFSGVGVGGLLNDTIERGLTAGASGTHMA